MIMSETWARAGIQARLRRAPEEIKTDTWNNRTQKTRLSRSFYQAGDREKKGRQQLTQMIFINLYNCASI